MGYPIYGTRVPYIYGIPYIWDIMSTKFLKNRELIWDIPYGKQEKFCDLSHIWVSHMCIPYEKSHIGNPIYIYIWPSHIWDLKLQMKSGPIWDAIESQSKSRHNGFCRRFFVIAKNPSISEVFLAFFCENHQKSLQIPPKRRDFKGFSAFSIKIVKNPLKSLRNGGILRDFLRFQEKSTKIP